MRASEHPEVGKNQNIIFRQKSGGYRLAISEWRQETTGPNPDILLDIHTSPTLAILKRTMEECMIISVGLAESHL